MASIKIPKLPKWVFDTYDVNRIEYGNRLKAANVKRLDRKSRITWPELQRMLKTAQLSRILGFKVYPNISRPLPKKIIKQLLQFNWRT